MHNSNSIFPRSSTEDIDITNDIMFSYVMSQNDICLKMISCLLPEIGISGRGSARLTWTSASLAWKKASMSSSRAF
ncbi:MAG: hypothetical protein SO135_02180 [Sphaerochaetaceae bacterium]|nr:hypothetical protein [Sphaerochaetaceae bacterium]